MKIVDYYREAANLSLNASIAALIPAIMITLGNLSFFQNQRLMLLTIPFLAYSFISFQICLLKLNRSIRIGRNLLPESRTFSSPFDSRFFLIVFLNSFSPRLQLYFPDGYLAGEIKKYRRRGSFVFFSAEKDIIGFFQVKGQTISVYDENRIYIGCLQKRKVSLKKCKKELFDTAGSIAAEVTGSAQFMDEHIVDKEGMDAGRLRRGWMPLEWETRFPEPNTPVWAFLKSASHQEKLLFMSLLINEYFIER